MFEIGYLDDGFLRGRLFLIGDPELLLGLQGLEVRLLGVLGRGEIAVLLVGLLGCVLLGIEEF